MNLVHIYGHTYGGNFVVTQIRELVSLGHNVIVICPGPGGFAKNIEALGVEVIYVDFQGAKVSDIFKILKSVNKIRSIIYNHNADVVHYHLIKAIIVGRLSVVFSKVKVRVSELGGPLTLEHGFFKWIDLLTSWIDSDIICSSKSILRIYSEHSWLKNKLSLLHYAFPTLPFTVCDKYNNRKKIREELNIANDVFVIGMVSHMYKSAFRRFSDVGIKGHEVLISAAKLLDNKNIKIVVVGQDVDGGHVYFDELVKLTKESNINNVFVFTGHKNNVAEMLSAFDISVVPSLSENCGGAVEPLLLCIPVIASNVGGLPDVVIPNFSGWLVPAKNEVCLANAINEAINSSKKDLDNMGKNGRDIVLRYFEPVENIKKLEAIYLARLTEFNDDISG